MTRETSPSRVISPNAGAAVETDLQLDYVGSIENAASVVSQLHRGEKRLVFCDSCAQAERLASLLRGIGTTTFVSAKGSAPERGFAQVSRRRSMLLKKSPGE